MLKSKNKILDELKKFEKAWLMIPFVFYAVGFFIHNIYLAEFYTFDFEIIQTKYIYVGIMATFYFLVATIFLTIGVEFNDEEKKSTLINFLLWLYRIPILALVMSVLLLSFDKVFFIALEIIETSIYMKIIIIFSCVVLFSYMSWFMISNVNDFPSNIRIIRNIRVFFSISIIPIYYSFVVFLNYKYPMSQIFNFAFMPIWLFSLLSIVLFASVKTKFIRRSEILLKLFNAMGFILVIFFILIIYSKNIYSHIPSNFGGSKPIYAKIFTDRDTISCKVINENSEWFLIQEQEVPIYKRIRVKSIQNIEISELPIFEPVILEEVPKRPDKQQIMPK